jgi:hypothetical protein
VVAALNAWRDRAAAPAKAQAAIERATQLARGDERHGYGTGGARLRLVMVPTAAGTLLDALALGHSGLVDELGTALRASGLVTNEHGLSGSVVERHVVLEAAGRAFESPRAIVGPDGAIVAEASVAGEGMLGGSVIEGPKVRAVAEQATEFAAQVWQRIDSRDEVRDVLVLAAVPEPEHKVFSDTAFSESSLQMGSSSTPAVLVAPSEPLVVRRADLGSAATLDRIVAEVRQAFADTGSVR